MAYRYPYIPDKTMYAAVMGACSYIRNTGYFHKAVTYYANKYNVDKEELERHIRARQGAGQRAHNKSKPKRKYIWFAVEYSMGNERNGCDYFYKHSAQYCVARGLSADTVKRRLSQDDDVFSEYAPCHWFGRVKECESEDDAIRVANAWANE